jgi:hypothetical protein
VYVMGRGDIYPIRIFEVGCLLHYVIAYLGIQIYMSHVHLFGITEEHLQEMFLNVKRTSTLEQVILLRGVVTAVA